MNCEVCDQKIKRGESHYRGYSGKGPWKHVKCVEGNLVTADSPKLERPTPETDTLMDVWRVGKLLSVGVMLDHVRKLERERDEALEKLADWENAAKHVEADHPDEVHCGCVPVLRKLLNEARAEVARLREKLAELYSIERERDEAREREEKLGMQIDRLDKVILDEFGGPTHAKDEGACDAAIRKLRNMASGYVEMLAAVKSRAEQADNLASAAESREAGLRKRLAMYQKFMDANQERWAWHTKEIRRQIEETKAENVRLRGVLVKLARPEDSGCKFYDYEPWARMTARKALEETK